MHGRTWGHYPTRHYTGAGVEMDLPLIPAPMAAATMAAGVLLGVMVGYKKARMVQAHRGMMGGKSYGMGGMHRGMGAMGGMGYGGDGARLMHKKAMMAAMAGHHHHDYGSAPCCCGREPETAASQVSAEDQERPDE